MARPDGSARVLGHLHQDAPPVPLAPVHVAHGLSIRRHTHTEHSTTQRRRDASSGLSRHANGTLRRPSPPGPQRRGRLLHIRSSAAGRLPARALLSTAAATHVFGLLGRGHAHKREAARLPGLRVAHHARLPHAAVATELVLQVLRRTAHVQRPATRAVSRVPRAVSAAAAAARPFLSGAVPFHSR